MRCEQKIVVPKFPIDAQFPGNPRDASAWNRFWSELLQDKEDLEFIRMDLVDRRYRTDIDLFLSLGFSNVLFVGNGISVLPHLFAHQGFQADVVEFSEVANEFNRNTPVAELFFNRFYFASSSRFGPMMQRFVNYFDLDKTQETIKAAHRPFGKTNFICEDIFEFQNPHGYQAIIIQNLVEHYSKSDRRLMSERLYEMLDPGAILIVESQYLDLNPYDQEKCNRVEVNP